MRIEYSSRRFRGGLQGAAWLAAGLALAGCSGSLGSMTPNWFPSVPGFSSVSSKPTDGSALAAAPMPSMDDNCPSADVRAGAGTLAVTTKTQQATASDVRYQLTFSEIARQCALSGNVIRMRVGVQGRAVAGPAGAPPQIEVPLRYAVVREGVDPKTIVTKFRRIPVAMPSGSGNVLFTDIEEDLSFPMPPVDELQAYVVYIGFDELGDRPARAVPAKKGKAK
jgi:hypothetical protein